MNSAEQHLLCLSSGATANSRLSLPPGVSLSSAQGEGTAQPHHLAKGRNVMLPCSSSPEQHAQDTEVTWFWEQLSPFVHHLRGGQDQYGEQMLQYQGHTELLKDGPAQGSTHLKIFHVQLSDRGNYTCFVQHGLDYVKVNVNMVLDPDTAHWDLVLSDDGKSVK
ncbi:myelin-oligodendrocyte glycoprotein-like [Passer domesticus]|uniref:myelin-oligodendrocyte glycoprotein-like n=1 Tax=Passer domesticus TaxID=48849 RepID=UPI0030FF1D88